MEMKEMSKVNGGIEKVESEEISMGEEKNRRT